MARATSLEKENLEAHVDLCEQRYNNLELRLSKIEAKVEHVHADITHGNKSMVKVIIGATGYTGLDLIYYLCLLYTSPSPRDRQKSRMPSSA